MLTNHRLEPAVCDGKTAAPQNDGHQHRAQQLS